MQLLTGDLKNLLNIFLKSSCPLCQRPTSQELCQNCTKQLQKCRLPEPRLLWHQPIPVFAWGTYSGSLKTALAIMKYQNHPEIARPLGKYLGQTWLSNCPISDSQFVVVPIPLHPNRHKKRGYNQAALIAQSFCQTTGLKLKINGLERTRDTEAQHKLSESQRKENLAKAFGIGEDFRRNLEASVILVDDIYTTGATAQSAIQTFHQAGIKVLGLVTTATTLKQENLYKAEV
ncbi:ComF family protein [Scytonema sp. NUACC21]